MVAEGVPEAVQLAADGLDVGPGRLALGLDIEARESRDFTVAEAREAVAAGAAFLLLDNMEPALLREVVAVVAGKAELEATGGLTLDRAREFAETGVDYLSVGGLTHSSPILDIALDLRPRKA